MRSASLSDAHSLDASEVLAALEVDAETGLAHADVPARRQAAGLNELPAAPRASVIGLLGAQFRSLLVIVLLLAAALNIAIWLSQGREAFPYDTIVILAIVAANAAIGFFQEYRAEVSLSELRELSAPRATVLREHSRRRLEGRLVVPGDIVLLASGDRVPADARLLDAVSLEADESMLTGESVTVLKGTGPVAPDAPLADRTSMVYAGTAIAAGRGTAVVTATGAATEMGSIARMLEQAPDRETPLKQSLDELARRLTLIIAAVSLVVFVTGLLVSGELTSSNVLNMLLFGVALAVAAIPEGLPAVVTGSLALGTQRMVRRQAVIRRLPAVETLGCTSAICSDKTGTLTGGEMTVRELLLPSGSVTLSGAGYQPDGGVEGDSQVLDEAMILAMSAVLCNDSSVFQDGEGRWHPLGTPTEASLVTMAAKLGLDYEHLREETRRIAEQPFSAERKRMSVIVSAGGGSAMLHTKGAPEIVLPLCSQVSRGGARQDLTGEERTAFAESARRMAERGLRPLAVATRPVGADACNAPERCEKDLVLLGLAGIADAPRPEVPGAIRECRQAGIDVFMVTGDHRATAEAVAAEVGVHGRSMTGREIDAASDAELAAAVGSTVEKVRIFARVSPGHKVRIVRALQEGGHVVAVTGDGVNDAPALRQADIGVAMGRTGTDVAREAADMVLLDDNFATIVAAIEEGRTIFTNIRKFLGFLLSSNSGLVLTLFLGVLLARPLGFVEDSELFLPLLAVQVLWINLVTNGPPALALGVEPREPEAMMLPPRPRAEPIVDRNIFRYIVLVGLVSGVTGIIILAGYLPGDALTFRGHADFDYGRTMAFVTLTLLQLFDSLNFRDLRRSVLPRLAGNLWLLAALALSAALMVAVVYWEPLQTAFHTRPLALSDWLIALAAGSVVLWAVELLKLASGWRDWSTGKIPLR